MKIGDWIWTILPSFHCEWGAGHRCGLRFHGNLHVLRYCCKIDRQRERSIVTLGACWEYIVFPGEEPERIQVDGNAYDCHLGVLKFVCARMIPRRRLTYTIVCFGRVSRSIFVCMYSLPRDHSGVLGYSGDSVISYISVFGFCTFVHS